MHKEKYSISNEHHFNGCYLLEKLYWRSLWLDCMGIIYILGVYNSTTLSLGVAQSENNITIFILFDLKYPDQLLSLI